MKINKIQLDRENENVYITAYVPDRIEHERDAMLVIPGGAYQDCSVREGEPIALAYSARGMMSFVLNYTICPDEPYMPLLDASRAMAWIRNNAANFNINRDRVFAVGFSAGGHLACSLGTLWNDGELNGKGGFEYGINRPKGTVLCYPVISSSEEFGHLGSFVNLLGRYIDDDKMRERFSLEKKVGEHTSPAFIIHTAEDEAVSVKNSLAYASALAEKGIMFEMHIYPHGSHGMALGTSETSCGREDLQDNSYAEWVDMSIEWMKRIK